MSAQTERLAKLLCEEYGWDPDEQEWVQTSRGDEPQYQWEAYWRLAGSLLAGKIAHPSDAERRALARMREEGRADG